jgi:hypothetical protein
VQDAVLGGCAPDLAEQAPDRRLLVWHRFRLAEPGRATLISQ